LSHNDNRSSAVDLGNEIKRVIKGNDVEQQPLLPTFITRGQLLITETPSARALDDEKAMLTRSL
jgi:hypothetical protein